MNQAEVQAEAISKEVAARLDNICRIVRDKSTRYEEASKAGAALAAEVYAYLDEDRPDVGYDRLREAYAEFMQHHAGNFWPSAPESVPVS